MRFRFYFLFIFFTVLFLFYPGDSLYYHTFAYNRHLFNQKEKRLSFKINQIPYVKTADEPQVSAEAVYIVDLNSFTPVYKKNSQTQFLPASTVKIITALVAYDVYDLDRVITVKNVVSEGQLMGLAEGEKITVENLLYGMLVHSGNDAAFALADNYGRDKFVDIMNKKAQKLGMEKSNFTNPAGFDDFSQLTTGYDLTLAARELLKNKLLKKIVSTKEITVSDSEYKNFHKLSNVNKLLGEIQGVGGLKTGFTENAGENLISFYKHNGHDLVLTILKSQDRFADTRELINWIDNNIGYTQVDGLSLIN